MAKTPVYKPLDPDCRKAVQKAVDDVKTILRRPERESVLIYSNYARRFLALALVPFLVLLTAVLIAPAADRLEQPPEPTTFDDRITAAETARNKAIAAITDPNNASPDLEAVNSALSDLKVARSAERDDTNSSAVKSHKLYRTLVIFLLAYVATALILIYLFKAQKQIVDRHWSWVMPSAWRGNEEKKPDYLFDMPGRVCIRYGGFAAGILGLLLYFANIPGPLTLPGSAKVLFEDTATGTLLISATVLLLFWLLSLLLLITVMGTNLYSKHFPHPRDIDRVADQFDRIEDTYGLGPVEAIVKLKDDKAMEHLAQQTRGAIKSLTNIKGPTKAARAQTNAGSEMPMLMIDPSFSASNAITVIRLMSLLAAIGMILVLVVLSLGIDVLEYSLPASGTFAEAAKATGDTWLLALGAGMSATLFIIFATSTARLLPFAEAEAKPKDTKPVWKITGSWAADNVSLEAKQPKEKNATDPWDDVAPEFNLVRAKFENILAASTKGGALHELADQSYSEQVTKLAGLLSPAIAGGLLTFLG